ncbi:hypothetical protein U1Q18_024784 [Sarracenia purpurea var. burkii]
MFEDEGENEGDDLNLCFEALVRSFGSSIWISSFSSKTNATIWIYVLKLWFIDLDLIFLFEDERGDLDMCSDLVFLFKDEGDDLDLCFEALVRSSGSSIWICVRSCGSYFWFC